MSDLSALHKEFQRLGYTRKRPGRLLSEWTLHITMSLAGTAAFVLVDGWALKALALLVMTFGNLGISTAAHTSSHNATHGRLWVNKALTYGGYSFWFGVAGTYWYNKHIAVHHPTPNVVGLDDDIDLLPWFALTEEDFQKGGRLRRFYHRHQWLLVPVAVGLNCFNIMQTSIRFLFGALRDPQRRTTAAWVDLGLLVSHFAVWLLLPMLFFPAGQVAAFYAARQMLMGYAMFAAFAPAHFPAEAWFLPTEGHDNKRTFKQATDFVLVQTVTTVNFRTGWFGRLLCAGVDYQIEHHLFPGISHTYYPQVSAHVRKYCEDRGYPYRTLGWGEAVWKSWMAFKQPRPVAPTVEASRPAVAAPAGAYHSDLTPHLLAGD